MQWVRQLALVEHIAPNAVMAHATLHEPEKWHYLRQARDVQPTLGLMKNKGTELGFFGHTHSQRWFAYPGATAQPNTGG